MNERLRSEVISEKFFAGVMGGDYPVEIEVSAKATDYYRKMVSVWA